MDRTDSKTDTPLTQQSSRDVLENTRRALINARAIDGAKTATGHHYSNIVELLQEPPGNPAHMVEYRTAVGETYFRNRRTDNLERQMRGLQRLKSDHQ